MNVEKAAQKGKFDPNAGLANSGIAGTGPDKEEEDGKNVNQDEEMKETPKESGRSFFNFFVCLPLTFLNCI